MSRILVVHPNLKACEAMESVLSKNGHDVLTAHGGASALKIFQSKTPDIVILNHELPRLRPFETFSEIKKLDPKAKILVFALLADSERKEAPARFGIRPLTPGEVVESLERLLNHAGGPAAAATAPRLLVVDDDPGVRDTLSRFLKGKGYEVATAPNGLEGFSLHKSFTPHLILLDIDMPKMTGIDALKRLREEDSAVAIMMVTGNDTLEMMTQCRDYGAYDYVLKPFDFDYLAFSVYSKVLLMNL